MAGECANRLARQTRTYAEYVSVYVRPKYSAADRSRIVRLPSHVTWAKPVKIHNSGPLVTPLT